MAWRPCGERFLSTPGQTQDTRSRAGDSHPGRDVMQESIDWTLHDGGGGVEALGQCFFFRHAPAGLSIQNR